MCLFDCLITKAVHIEAVSSKPYNGSNFVGISNILQELHRFLQQENNKNYSVLSKDFIKFHRILPRSPNFGSLWEAAIKCIKFRMTRLQKQT